MGDRVRLKQFGPVAVTYANGKRVIVDNGGGFPLHILEHPNDKRGSGKLRDKLERLVGER